MPAWDAKQENRSGYGEHVGQNTAEALPRWRSLRDISRRTGLPRNTIRRWLREPSTGEPKYPKRAGKSVIDAWAEQLRQWLIADSRLPKRGRRTATQMYEELRTTDYDGSY